MSIKKLLLNQPAAAGGGGDVIGPLQPNTYTYYAWGNGPLQKPRVDGEGVPIVSINNSNWTQISSNNSTAMALRSDGTLWGWGLNTASQLGDGTTTSRSSPVQIALGSWTAISQGESHRLAISSDGQLYGWGTNLAGEILTPLSWSTVPSGVNFNAAIAENGELYVWGSNTGSSLSPSPVIPGGLYSWKAVGLGADHWVAIRSDGTLWAWGQNANGQLGDGTTTSRATAVQVSTSSWMAVSCTESSTMAIRSDGTLWAWGANDLAQLGDATLTPKSSPVQISASSWKYLSSGYSHTTAIDANDQLYSWGADLYHQYIMSNGAFASVSGNTWAGGATSTHFAAITSDGTLYLWGLNGFGQLGDGTTSTRSFPVTLSAGLGLSWQQVSVGTNHTVAIKSDGTLWAWGQNTSGQLGDGNSGAWAHVSSPVQIGTSSWSVVAAGVSHTLAVRTDGALFAWGGNTNGQLGDDTAGAAGAKSSPVQIGTSSWTAVVAGASNSAAVRSDGQLFVWGGNSQSQVGDRTTVDRSSPVILTAKYTSNWAKIAIGQYHSAIINQNGAAYLWGLNANGQLGNNSTATARTPDLNPIGSWTALALGDIHTVGLKSDGSLWAWGGNGWGQLGDGTVASRSSPVQIGTSSWSAVAAGFSHTLAVRADGALFAWGHNTTGQLGDSTSTNKSSPVQIGTSSWTAVAAGASYAAALRTDGALFAWGLNIYGQLGDGTIVNKSSPVKIGTSSWTAVAAGASHAVALRTDGALFTWGSNLGQLGDSTILNRSSPVQIGTSSWTAIAAGISHTVALRTDSALFTWGGNGSSQLGDGTTVNKSSPVQIGTSSWTAVAAGGARTFVLRVDSAIYGFGQQSYGELGDNSTATRTTPTPVLAQPVYDSAYVSVSLGDGHAVALRTDGGLLSWGRNTEGQLGDLTTASKSSPVQIGTSSWSAVSAGRSYTTAIDNTGALWAWGYNGLGQLGNGSVVSRSSPVKIGTNSWTAVAAGAYQAFGSQTDGTIWSWGRTDYGIRGTASTSTPQRVTLLGLMPTKISTSSWTMASAGTSHSHAIASDGSLWGWGHNANYQLGDGTATTKSEPVKIGTSSWAMVSAGKDYSLGIKVGGAGRAAGVNSHYQFGNNLAVNANFESNIIGPAGNTSSWSAVSASRYNVSSSPISAGINSTGSLFTWGTQNSPATGLPTLGNGNNLATSQSAPALVWSKVNSYLPRRLLTGSWSAVAAGLSYSLAISNTGKLWAWGNNTAGRLGDNTIISRSSPVQIGVSSWSAVAAGASHTVAINNDGTLYAWGLNSTGAVGDNSGGTQSAPVRIAAGSWSAISVAAPATATTQYSLAVRADGTLWAWGYNTGGQLGDETTTHRSRPVVVTKQTASWAAVSAYPAAGILLAKDYLGNFYAIGSNSYGLLADQTTASNDILELGKISGSWTQLSTNGPTTLGIRPDGTLWAWGYNFYGQFGNGVSSTASSRSSPVQIGTSSWSAVAVGPSHTVAILSDGTLWAWGYNTDGQLGDGTTVSKNSPVRVGTSSWTAIAAAGGAGHNLAIRKDGTLWAWGYNGQGRLGDITGESRSSPVQIGTSSWSAVAAGSSHSVAIRIDGGLFAWGYNSYGQLGDGTTTNKSSPVKLGTGSWTAMAAGALHALAVRSDGALFAWGDNTSGIIGDGSAGGAFPGVQLKSSPVQVGTSSWSAVAAGRSHSAAIKIDGTVWTWGSANTNGLGDRTTIARSSPVQIGMSIPDYTITVGKVSAGFYSAAIRTDGSLWTWGPNNNNTLANNLNTATSSPVKIGTSSWTAVATGMNNAIVAVKKTGALATGGSLVTLVLGDLSYTSPVVINAGKSWQSISVGPSHTVAILSDGTLWAWGLNNSGQLGDQTIISRISPVQIGSDTWKMASAGSTFSAAIRYDNALLLWGLNTSGQLGTNDYISRSSPTIIPSTWKNISLGGNYVMAIDSNNRLYAWGNNTIGLLGLSSTSGIATPMQVFTNTQLATWNKISTGDLATFAVRNDGSLWSWGNNTYGQLGFASATESTPMFVSGNSWSVLSSCTGHAIAIQSDGSLWAWGLNTNGQLGDGTTTAKSSPVKIGTSSWSAVAAGTSHSVALRTDGVLFTWGAGTSGRLGDSTTVSKSSPVQIGTSSWTAVAAGSGHSVALRTDGALFTWGLNTTGQMGDSTAVSKSSPVQIGTSSWSVVAARESNTVALRTDGALFTWGINASGQLGDGTVVTKSSPVKIGTSSWSAVAAGSSHSVALRTDGALFTWGGGTVGQLGDGTTVSKSSPVKIGTSSWTAVAAGSTHSVALRTDGTLFAWGQNIDGQLGDGTATYKPSPVQVAALPVYDTLWSAASAGASHTAAIRSDGALFTWGLGTSGQLGDGTAVSKSSPVLIGAYTMPSLLLNMNGSNGSTTFTDTTGLNTVTAVGNASLSSTQSKFGGTSGYFDGTGDYLAIPASTNFNFGSDNFTVEGWFWAPSSVLSDNLYHTFFMFGSTYGNNSISVEKWRSGLKNNLLLRLYSGATLYEVDATATTIPTNQWFHLAVVRNGTTVTMYLNGTSIGSVTVSTATFPVVPTGTAVPFAVAAPGENGPWLGYIDDIRVTKGLAIYTSNFTVPNSELTTRVSALGYNPSSAYFDDSWTAVAVGNRYNVALRTDGALFTWGINASGQLGDGTVVTKSSPVKIGTSSWTAVTAGVSHVAALRTDGALFAWGENSSGQLGDSTTVSQSSPVQIGTSSWSAVSAGFSITAALRGK